MAKVIYMLLIDSLYINNSGGKILLDYLVEEIEKHQIPTFYLFDARCSNDFHDIPEERKVYMKASLISRYRFYRENAGQFSKVFCFANLPPAVHLNIPVYTYFHQRLFLDIPASVSVSEKLKFRIKTAILSLLKRNTSLWFVQSETIRKGLAAKYRIHTDHIKVIPFYPPLLKTEEHTERRKDGFVYISNGGPHKNHPMLIEAFCNYFAETGNGVLHLTVNDTFPQLQNLIKAKRDQGYPIINHGFIRRDKLSAIYQSAEYMIYPSLAESFGLGLIEAMESGCKIIGADLAYTYAVCRPSLVFNPLSIRDTERAFADSQSGNTQDTRQLVFNQMSTLIEYLKT